MSDIIDNKAVGIILGVFAFILMLAGFGIGRYTIDADTAETVVLERSDTVMVRDTVYGFVPVPTNVYVVRYDTIFISDTVFVPVPITASEYATDLYRLTVEGYKTRLLDIEVYPRTVTVTNERDVVRTVRYERAFLPFVSGSWSTFNVLGVGGGVYYKKFGVSYEWQWSVAERRSGHRVGVAWRF